MQIKNPRDIGREARTCRRFLRLKQADLARACGVSRQWVSALEAGKPSLELSLVLRAYAELGLDLTAARAPDPPRWTRVLTADAEMREARSLNARRRRRLEARMRERAVQEGNLLEN